MGGFHEASIDKGQLKAYPFGFDFSQANVCVKLEGDSQQRTAENVFGCFIFKQVNVCAA